MKEQMMIVLSRIMMGKNRGEEVEGMRNGKRILIT